MRNFSGCNKPQRAAESLYGPVCDVGAGLKDELHDAGGIRKEGKLGKLRNKKICRRKCTLVWWREEIGGDSDRMP
jgi:hypothetical protein